MKQKRQDDRKTKERGRPKTGNKEDSTRKKDGGEGANTESIGKSEAGMNQDKGTKKDDSCFPPMIGICQSHLGFRGARTFIVLCSYCKSKEFVNVFASAAHA